MIPRYTRPEMGRIWSDENKFRCWLKVEAAASLTLAEAGIVPENAARAIAERGDFDLKRIHEIEAEVKHDVIAFTTAVAEKVGVVETAADFFTKRAGKATGAGLMRFLRNAPKVAPEPDDAAR